MLLFPLKIHVLAAIWATNVGQEMFFQFLRRGAFVCIVATLITLPIVAIFVLQGLGIYYTASPNLMVPLAYLLARNSNRFYWMMLVVLSLATGKRGIFIGIISAIIIYTRKFTSVLFIGLLLLAFGYVIFVWR